MKMKFFVLLSVLLTCAQLFCADAGSRLGAVFLEMRTFLEERLDQAHDEDVDLQLAPQQASVDRSTNAAAAPQSLRNSLCQDLETVVNHFCTLLDRHLGSVQLSTVDDEFEDVDRAIAIKILQKVTRKKEIAKRTILEPGISAASALKKYEKFLRSFNKNISTYEAAGAPSQDCCLPLWWKSWWQGQSSKVCPLF